MSFLFLEENWPPKKKDKKALGFQYVFFPDVSTKVGRESSPPRRRVVRRNFLWPFLSATLKFIYFLRGLPLPFRSVEVKDRGEDEA